MEKLTLEERHKNSLALHLASRTQHAKYSKANAQYIECLITKHKSRIEEQMGRIESAQQILSLLQLQLQSK